MTRTVAEVEADIAEVHATRRRIMAGEHVEEILRDGRRLTFAKVTLDSLAKLLNQLKAELADAQATENAGQTRYTRRPIGFSY